MATTRTSTTGSRAGFTLLELLIALTLGAILATAAYQSMSTALAGRDRAMAALEPVGQARYLFASLDRDLRRLDPRGRKGDLDCGGEECLFPVQSKEGERAWVRYRLKGGEMLREQLAAEDKGLAVAAAPAVATVAARGLARARFASRPSGIGPDRPFPRLVALDLDFERADGRGGRQERFSHAVFLEITIDDDQATAH